jgi:DNA gyrase inhibitor GyrI
MAHLQQLDPHEICEYWGMSGIDETRFDSNAMVYQAGVTLANRIELRAGLLHREINKGKYARFVLRGPYAKIWMAFDQVFKVLAEKKVALRSEFYIENYLNDPRVTPEDELKTELLIPIA